MSDTTWSRFGKVYEAYEARSITGLRDALSMFTGEDVYFDPEEQDPLPSQPRERMLLNPVNYGKPGGSIVGLCVSEQWHEGLQVCADLGINPNRNSLVRCPLLWAYSNDDLVALGILLRMRIDPMMIMIDTRTWGLPDFEEEMVNRDRIEELIAGSPYYGKLDEKVLRKSIKQHPSRLRPKLSALLLNDPRQHSVEFIKSLVDNGSNLDFSDVKYYANIYYYKMKNWVLHLQGLGKGDFSEAPGLISEMFAFDPNRGAACGRVPWI